MELKKAAVQTVLSDIVSLLPLAGSGNTEVTVLEKLVTSIENGTIMRNTHNTNNHTEDEASGKTKM